LIKQNSGIVNEKMLEEKIDNKEEWTILVQT
jgi:hypothetical protein